jgi:hypothetical protein
VKDVFAKKFLVPGEDSYRGVVVGAGAIGLDRLPERGD